jgi:hypothetical protein
MIKMKLDGHKNTIWLAGILAGILLLTGCASDDGSSNHSGTMEQSGLTATFASGSEAVALPKLQLSLKSNESADMIGLIVYKGNIYTQTDTQIAPEQAAALVGEKLGRTKGNIDEWSSQDEYATEFASSIGEGDVYSVKGYDETFRIMVYGEREGQVWAEFYECMNGITVTSGQDVFDKLKLAGHVQAAVWETYESWNNGSHVYRSLPLAEPLDDFITALNAAKPIEQKLLQEKLNIFNSVEQKFLLLQLDDHTEIRLRLFKGNYVMYHNAHVFFQMDEQVFAALWNSLE